MQSLTYNLDDLTNIRKAKDLLPYIKKCGPHIFYFHVLEWEFLEFTLIDAPLLFLPCLWCSLTL